MSVKNFLLKILLQLFALLIISCSGNKVLSDLSEAQKGEFYFYSNNVTFSGIMKKNINDKSRVKVFGILSLPDNIKSKVPAVIILHGISGAKPRGSAENHYTDMAKILTDAGIAAFIVDSQKTRIKKDYKAGRGDIIKKVTLSMRVADAYAALKLLGTHPKIDKNKIALMGVSRGGNVAHLALSEKIRKGFINDDRRFAGAVLYYPSCRLQLKNIDFADSPVLFLLGGKDNITPSSMALDYAERIRSSGARVETVIYRDAYHGFDVEVLAGITYQFGDDYSGCSDNYFLLDSEGMIYSTRLKKKAHDPASFGNIFKDCKKAGMGMLGGPADGRKKSIRKYLSFYKRVFGL